MDSAALVAHYLREGRRVHPVYVRSGYVWEPTEVRWLKRLLAALAHPRLERLACLSVLEAAKSRTGWEFTGKRTPGARSADASVYLPGRNLVLLSAASVLCWRRSLPAVAMGILKGNPFPDATPAFFSLMERTLASGYGRPLEIETPFRRMSKKRVMEGAGQLPWALTFSCLSPSGGKPCGRCNKCAERRKALSILRDGVIL